MAKKAARCCAYGAWPGSSFDKPCDDTMNRALGLTVPGERDAQHACHSSDSEDKRSMPGIHDPRRSAYLHLFDSLLCAQSNGNTCIHTVSPSSGMVAGVAHFFESASHLGLACRYRTGQLRRGKCLFLPTWTAPRSHKRTSIHLTTATTPTASRLDVVDVDLNHSLSLAKRTSYLSDERNAQ